MARTARPNVVIAAAVLIGMTAAALQACSPSADPSSASPPGVVPSSAGAESFPDAGTTGPPDESRLVPYDGPCVIDDRGTEIEDRIITCDRVVVQADEVTIRASLIRGRIDIDDERSHLTLEDVEIDAGAAPAPAVGFANLTIRRSEIRGGQTSVQCASRCVIEDSVLHQQMEPVGDQHLGGYLSNGGSEVVLRHNRIACTPRDNSQGGGCTGSLQIFGDFSELSDFRFENNLVMATPGGYCASFGHNPGKPYGSDPQGIVVVNNVFERGPSGRCGVWGASTSFLEGGQGNVWEGNVWDDGSALSPGE